MAIHSHGNANIDKLVVEETYIQRGDDGYLDKIIDGIFGPDEESEACVALHHGERMNGSLKRSINMTSVQFYKFMQMYTGNTFLLGIDSYLQYSVNKHNYTYIILFFNNIVVCKCSIKEGCQEFLDQLARTAPRILRTLASGRGM